MLAGVPPSLQAMFAGLLAGGDRFIRKTVGGYIGEGVIAKDLGALQDRYRCWRSAPTRSSAKEVRRGFVIRGTDKAKIAAAAEELLRHHRQTRRRTDRGARPRVIVISGASCANAFIRAVG